MPQNAFDTNRVTRLYVSFIVGAPVDVEVTNGVDNNCLMTYVFTDRTQSKNYNYVS